MAGNPNYAAIDNAAASGNLTVVAAKAGFRVRVIGYLLVSAGTTVEKFTDAAGGAALTGPMSMAANSQIIAPAVPNNPVKGFVGWFETSAGNALVLNSSQAIQVSGHVLYLYVPG